MLKDITIGQYVDTGSVIHKLDPRTKIILLLAYLIMLFCVSSLLSYIIIFIFTAVIIAVSRIPLKFIVHGLKPMLFILIFTTVINLFVTPGEAIWSLKLFFGWTLKISYEGIRMAVLMSFRLLLLVIASSLLTLTTSPMALTDGIERLLRPLSKIKVPAHEIAMMMTIAIRFIPTLAEEADKIMKAQTARGADFESGNLIQRVKAMLPLLVPLFISAFRRADDLAVAMDARCYHGGKNRTRMKEIKAGRRDFAAVLLMAALAILLAAVTHFGF
jgi:energy-coupling factor transport system permease protein